MSNRLQNNGFSLTEVLMAAGILAIGFAFIAGMFPVGVKLTAIATEQTIAPIVVDEAIAKIKLYGDPNFVEALRQAELSSPTEYINFADVCYIPDYEFIYPSTDISPDRRWYHWSALCGLLGDGNVHVIVFVSRRAGAGAQYLTYESDYTSDEYGQALLDIAEDDWPVPVRVLVNRDGDPPTRTLIIPEATEENYISTGSTIVDDETGEVYRVIERIRDYEDEIILIMLDRDWEGPVSGFVWVVPPAVTSSGPPVQVGGRYPCVRVDPTHTIRF